MQERQAFARQLIRKRADSRHVSARPTQARDKAIFHRIGADCQDNRNRRGGGFRRPGRPNTSGRNDHSYLPTDESCRKQPQFALIIRPMVLNGDVLAFDVPGCRESLAEASKLSSSAEGIKNSD